MLPLLKIDPEPSDSLKVAITETIQNVKSMSGQDIIDSLLDTATHLGLKILAAILLYIVGTWIIKRVKKLLKTVFEKRKIEPSLSTFTISFVNISLTVLLFVIIVSILGVPTSTFAALLAAGGVAVGMALSGTLQNFAGGIMILLFKPFKVGDYIEAGGFGGTVDAINITTTQIHTPDNKIVFLPNGAISGNNIENYSIANARRVDWNITISYGDDAQKGIDLLKKYLNEDKRVLTSPDVPFAAVAELGESAVVLVARAWTRPENYWSLLYDMNKLIYERFPKEGLNFPFPQMEVSIKKEA